VNALVDTNIVLRVGGSDRPASAAVNATLAGLIAGGWRVCVSAQSLVEAWTVLTRPAAANGIGLSPSLAKLEIDRIMGVFTLLPDPPDLFPRWLDLCTTHEVRGRQAYDARLVALMLGAGITRFVTLNPVDFARFPMLDLIVPGTTTEPLG
jgi:predicted nucleic acid-binding protein